MSDWYGWYGYAAGVHLDSDEVWQGTSKCQPAEVEFERRCRWCFRMFGDWKRHYDHETKCAKRPGGE